MLLALRFYLVFLIKTVAAEAMHLQLLTSDFRDSRRCVAKVDVQNVKHLHVETALGLFV
jgi:hypothetical protein